MVRHLKGLSGIVVVLTLLALTASALAREPDPAQVTGASSRLVVTRVASRAEQKATLAFWTHEAIAAARPMGMPSQFGPAEVDTAALFESMVSGPPGFVAAGVAAPGADQAAQAAYPRDWAALKENS